MFKKGRTEENWAQNIFAGIGIIGIIIIIIGIFKLYQWYKNWTLPSDKELIQINSNVPEYGWKHDCFLAYNETFKQRTQLRFWRDGGKNICSEKSSSCFQKIDYYDIDNTNRNCVTEGLSKVREVDISKIKTKTILEDNKEDTESVFDNEKYKTYTNSKFSFQCPKNWTYEENIDPYDIIFMSESKNKDPLSAGSIMFNLYEFPGNKEPDGGDITLDMLFDYRVANINEHSRILSKEDSKINGTLAKKLLFETIEENGKKTKSEIVILIKNRISYEIIYTALTEYFDDFYKEANEIISSFKSE